MTSKQTVGIIGGGIMGISLGYFLAKQGMDVTIYEASPVLGKRLNTYPNTLF